MKFPDTSRGTFQRLIESEDVLVNNRPTKATYHPQAGDEICIQWPEPVAAEAQPENIPLNILFEDEQLIVLNKPVGMVVHPAAGHALESLHGPLQSPNSQSSTPDLDAVGRGETADLDAGQAALPVRTAAPFALDSEAGRAELRWVLL